jgi:dihydroorotase
MSTTVFFDKTIKEATIPDNCSKFNILFYGIKNTTAKVELKKEKSVLD